MKTNLFLFSLLTLPVRAWHRIKYRRSQTLCLSNTAANPTVAKVYEFGMVTKNAETALVAAAAQFLLVKMGTTGDNYVDVCGASDLPLGVSLDVATATTERPINVQLLGVGPTQRMTANGAIAAGVNVYAAASGKIASTGTQIVGISITAAGAGGDVIAVNAQPVFPAPGIAASLYDANTILYATTDNTPVALTVGASTIVGRGASGAIVALTPAQSRTVTAQKGVIALPLKLVQVTTNMNIYTSLPIPFACTVTAFDAFVYEVVTTGSKLTTITPFINSTAITGAGVALTSANSATLGAKIAGGAITAANVTAEGDTITIKSTSTTAFSEGAVELWLQYTIAA